MSLPSSPVPPSPVRPGLPRLAALPAACDAIAATPLYRRLLAAWATVFCGGFAVLPGEMLQRALFYGALPLILPAAVAAARRLRPGPLAWSLGAFLLDLGVSGLWSDDPATVGKTLQKALAIGCFLLVCVAIGQEGGGRGARQWQRILRGAVLIAAGFAVVSLAVHLTSCADCRFIGFGRHANANYTAAVAGSIGVLALAAVLIEPGRNGLVLLTCQVPLLGLLIATGSRAALLAYLGVGLMCATLVALRGRRQQAVRAFVAIGTLLAVAVAAAAWLGWGWIEAEIGRGDTYRLFIWSEDITRFFQHPLLGHGAEASDEFAVNGQVVGYHAHNLFLAQAFYGGVIGLALWTAVVVTALRVAWRAWRTRGDFLPLAGLAFLLVVGSVDMGPVLVDVQAIWLYVWVVLGITLSYEAAGRTPRQSVIA
jgi:O-antigen ligase